MMGMIKREPWTRTVWILGFQPPWKEDGICIATPDPNWKFKFRIHGIDSDNDECASWFLAIAGSGIKRLGDNEFEETQTHPLMTIGQMADWKVGRKPWELLSHGTELVLQFDDFLDSHLDALALTAKQEIAVLCAQATQRIEQYA
ncbi:hypothetical protein [Pseudomonas syringae]|uniref:hypothetical protein n=1 Tax=Pseudomonas syringae TaxID=317 RepID=UPI001F2E6EE2|nr:hypothetical protein [Pseudomonas syringae]MCF5371352.1 hypothetical protein [Pseudomonas syringae]MCF5382478.1 hypothetical protein [Pseudomonas syringae]MCF5419365.1 hypothetical protein [Pseudomonas syringae]MCF5455045.1 hypothetical protein [Pseudomonas syringae]MCF5460487.1 hypothetical protein [Pseudomonas syringae]